MLRKLLNKFDKPPTTNEYSRESLIRLPVVDSKSNFLDGFWSWVKVLECRDFQRALESLYWESATTWTPEKLEKRITTFFGGEDAWSVVVPNDRLVNEINKSAEVELGNLSANGWFMAQIPLTTQPEKSKDDDIPLMGLAVSFFVREYEGQYVIEHEIFHL